MERQHTQYFIKFKMDGFLRSIRKYEMRRWPPIDKKKKSPDIEHTHTNAIRFTCPTNAACGLLVCSLKWLTFMAFRKFIYVLFIVDTSYRLPNQRLRQNAITTAICVHKNQSVSPHIEIESGQFTIVYIFLCWNCGGLPYRSGQKMQIKSTSICIFHSLFSFRSLRLSSDALSPFFRTIFCHSFLFILKIQ